MEVDMQHSASFHRMAVYPNLGTKRARSFDEDSPSQRPTKRISISTGNNFSAPLFPSQPGSRQPSEDWVQQTDGLSIGTPLASNSPSPSTEDVDMDEAPAPTAPANSFPSRYSHAESYSRPGHQQMYGSTLHVPQQPPTIAVLPPTPETTRRTEGSDLVAGLRTPKREASMMSMDSTPIPSACTSPKKQRFTMGPRVDCMKCRMGVKGHYSHF